jgi:hypothetical protein
MNIHSYLKRTTEIVATATERNLGVYMHPYMGYELVDLDQGEDSTPIAIGSEFEIQSALEYIVQHSEGAANVCKGLGVAFDWMQLPPPDEVAETGEGVLLTAEVEAALALEFVSLEA